MASKTEAFAPALTFNLLLGTFARGAVNAL
jgi:hypothetical protein